MYDVRCFGHSGMIYCHSSIVESYTLVSGLNGLLDSHVLWTTPTCRPSGHDSFDQCLLGGWHLFPLCMRQVPAISNTYSIIRAWVECRTTSLDLWAYDREPTEHGTLCYQFCWFAFEEVLTEHSVDLAFITMVVGNILSTSHQNVAWVDVPACSLLCWVIAHVVHYDANHVLIPR